jgi:hypothetical protein
VLIGAGVILAAVSYLVEQVSRVTAVPIAENELARGLARMALPVEGLSPTGRSPMGHRTPRPAPPPAPPGGGPWTWVALGGIAAMVAFVILAMVQNLRTELEPADPDRAITLELQVMDRDLDQPAEQIVRALWATCQTRVPKEVQLTGLQRLATADRIRIRLSPAPGEYDTRELIGCLQDAVIERVRADLLATGSGADTTAPAVELPRA